VSFPLETLSSKAVDSTLLTLIKAELASGQAQQERHQRQPSAAPLKEHPFVVVVTAVDRLLRALHRSYRLSIRISICEREHVTSFRADDELARLTRLRVQSITTTDFHPPTPASSYFDVARVLRAIPCGRVFPPPPLPLPIVAYQRLA